VTGRPLGEGERNRFASTRARTNVCGVGVDAVEMSDAVDRILRRAREQESYSVTAMAVHGLVECVRDQTQRRRVESFDLIVPDGQPVRWAVNLLHRAGLRERVYGPALMLELCEAAAQEDIGVYLYGSSANVLGPLQDRLQRRFPTLRVVGCKPSRFESLDTRERLALARDVNASGAGLCFVGLGCPRQEKFCWAMRDQISAPVIAVGAAFDFHAGRVQEAPTWMQKAGLQWVHRLTGEPRRLWRRYLLLNPTYAALVALQLSRVWKPDHALPEPLESSVHKNIRTPG
jgi:exopolysaccharide biosynthesis WecB/TagA/CpsF family protein